MRVGPRRLMPTVPGRIGAPARKYSSSKITCCMKLAPRPPYSFGQESPTQPAACIFFCQVRRRSSVSRSGETRWSCASSTFKSSVRFASSHSRNSRRNAACSGASAKSIGALLQSGKDSGRRPVLSSWRDDIGGVGSMLTEAQVAKYRYDGYLYPFPALSADELAEANEGLARYESWLGTPVNQADRRWRSASY